VDAGLNHPREAAFQRLTADLSFARTLRIRGALAARQLGLLAPLVFRPEGATSSRFLVDGLRSPAATCPPRRARG
jgi:hypothetical protein